MTKLKYFITITLFLGLSSSWAIATGENSLLDAGLKKYQQKDYVGAEALWAQALKQSPLDASLLFNQALAFSQQKKWGLALAFLREAQLLSPRHKGIEKALDYLQTNMKSRGFRSEESLISAFESSMGKYFLLPEVLTAHWILSLGVLFLLGRLYRERRRAKSIGETLPPWRPIHWVGSGVWGLASLFLLFKIAGAIDQRATVIRTGTVAIRSGPLADAAELADLPEGALISVKDYYKDWVQIHYDQLPVGWVSRKDLLLLTPEGFK